MLFKSFDINKHVFIWSALYTMPFAYIYKHVVMTIPLWSEAAVLYKPTSFYSFGVGFFSQRVPRRSAGRLWRARHVCTGCWRSRDVHVWVGQHPQPVGGWSLWPAPVPRQRPRLLQRRLVRVSAATRRSPSECISCARRLGHDSNWI